MWLLAILVVGPLLALFAVSIAIMVSSRVNDPRVAEQLSGAVAVPIILLLVGQSVGFLLLSQDAGIGRGRRRGRPGCGAGLPGDPDL
jgi:ABC-2 type transport system permease protein